MVWWCCGIDTYNSTYGNYVNVDVYDSTGENIIKASGSRTKLNTGVTTFTMKNNIYDLAGNNAEVSQTANADFMRLSPGGMYRSSIPDYSLASKNYNTNMTFGVRVFLTPRIQLYIK